MRNTHLLRIAYSYLPTLSDTTLTVCTSPLSQTTLDPLLSFLRSFLPCALGQPKFLDFFQITTSYSVSLIKPSIPQRRRISCLLWPRWPEPLSLHDISRVFRVLSQSHVSSGPRFCSAFVIRKNPHPRGN